MRIQIPYDPETPLLDIYLKKLKTFICKDICTPMFTAALFTAAKMRRQLKCPSTGDWIKTMWSICTMEYYSTIRKDEILPFGTTWMDLKNITLSKISQTEKVKNHMISLVCEI